jgi:PPOX class probable F420-dependent enzyme
VFASPSVFAPFDRQRTVALATYRRDGTPVITPVSIAVAGERAFVRTWETAGKFKRIRANPEVAVAPSTFRGRPTGPSIRARARPLTDEESVRAAQAIARKYPILHGVLVPLAHRLKGYRTVQLELTPLDGRDGLSETAARGAGV